MKVAIHHFENSFSQRWIEYCEENNINYTLIDCFSSNVIKQMVEFDVLMWHWSQEDPKAMLIAKNLTKAIESMGKKVFPDFNTVWHFDNKISQKYLLEALNVPLVSSYVFYSENEALEWAKNTKFPKVFKLKGGAGSINVKLIKNSSSAKKIIKKAFSKGFGSSGRTELFKNRIWHFKRDKDLNSFVGILKGVRRLFLKSNLERFSGREKGYVYFQDFVPNNDSDTRIIVIGNRAFAIKRMVRKGDFRASGSGLIKYINDETIDKKCLEIAFETSKKLKSQCLAFDFIYDGNSPLIVEISYGFSIGAYDSCPGYWDKHLIWHEGYFVPQHFMIQNILKE